MSGSINVSRRGFLAASGGLVIGFVLAPRGAHAQDMPTTGYFGPFPEHRPNAYIRIGADDSVTFLIPRSEMGQGPTTGCSQMLAEELGCDWTKVRMEIAPVDPDTYGLQTTVGSMATRTTWVHLRRAGAEAREMLILAAAQQWNVSPSQCKADTGFIVNTATGARLSHGKLAEAASKLPVPQNVQLKDPSQYTIIGKPVKRLDTRDKILSRAQFGLDARPAGLLYAVLERCPVFGGKIVSFDATDAKKVPGVRDVIQVPGWEQYDVYEGVAVIADNTWAAIQGRKALHVQWDERGNANISSASIRQLFLDKTSSGTGLVAKKQGDANAALARATKRVDATYEVPFFAHATMEPMNCTVQVRGDGTAEAWVPTQSPTTARAVVARVLGIKPEKVVFHTLFCGGGFGRRGEGELTYIFEAAEIAKRVNAPVQLMMTREDDMQHDQYRPAALVKLTGAIDGDGWPAVFKASLACPQFLKGRTGVDGTMVNGLSDLQYAFSDFLLESQVANTHVPVSAWRAPGAAHNTYFAECFFDELCAAGGKDPVEARRRLLAKSPRLLNCLNVAAEEAGWGSPAPAGRFRGVSVNTHVESFLAQVAEVSVTNGRVRVHKVVVAFDAGQVINPHILRQQIEGGVTFGLSATLKGGITIERGRVVEANFDKMDMMRIDEAPEVDVHIIPSTEKPGGVGEATNPGTVPAVVNAIFAATGKRIRALPVRRADLA
jgi:isoquinoline 1-oxidoreductase beta subunit